MKFKAQATVETIEFEADDEFRAKMIAAEWFREMPGISRVTKLAIRREDGERSEES